MFNIHIITLGALTKPYWKEAEAEYKKRLGTYAKIKITELKEEPFSAKDSAEQVKEKEAKKILPYVEKAKVVFAMHEAGREFDSPAFAKELEQLSMHGDELTFVFGGPLGFHESVLEKATMKLSLSALTFPHQLARVILLEQLYRAGTILAGKTYHY